MLTTLRTIFIGESRRAEEKMRDHYALDLIAQKIRETEDALKAAKGTLGALIQRQRSETRQIDGLNRRLVTMTERAQAALSDDNETLAAEAAQAVATMENERKVRETTLERLDQRIIRLKSSVETMHRRIIDLKQGEIAAEVLAGHKAAADWRGMPAAIFTEPQIATVGLSEREAKESGRKVKIGKFPFAASGRAMTLGETDGFTKVVADRETDVVLGVHMVGPEAGEIVQLAERTLAGAFRTITPSECRVILLDAAPAVLPPMGPKLGAKAQHKLEKMDVEVQLNAMVTFIISAGLDDELRKGDWRGFARGYNGPAYATHNYHGRLKAAFTKWARIKDTPFKAEQFATLWRDRMAA